MIRTSNKPRIESIHLLAIFCFDELLSSKHARIYKQRNQSFSAKEQFDREEPQKLEK